MWNQFLESLTSINQSIDVLSICASLAVGFILGLIVFLAYKLTTNEFEFELGFGLVLIIISMIVSVLICAIGTNLARSLSVAGILSLTRYRSSVVKPRDLAFVFFSMGVGFISGIGFYLPALIMTVVISLVIVIYSLAGLAGKKAPKKTLRIAVPENIDYDGIFDDVLKKYTSSFSLRGIKIISGGTVTELTYDIRVKDMTEAKAFLDELRVLNANFKIQLTEFVAE